MTAPEPRPCPFCAPDPRRIFHEAPLVLGLWDGFPVSPGHALLVPRRHVATWFESSLDEQLALLAGVEVARARIEEAHRPDGYNIGVNVGAAAGQTVPHLHLHVIPRYAGDVRDPTGGVRLVIPHKGNYLARPRQRLADEPHQRSVVTGLDDPLGPHLVAGLATARQVDVAVAFVLPSGMDRVEPHFRDLVARRGRLRLVTGDYLDVTDPVALRRLLDVAALADTPDQVQLRVFETRKAGTSFHPKAYLLSRGSEEGEAVAYVGSANLSGAALDEGVEWSSRVVERAALGDLADAFETLLAHPATTPLTADWIRRYERYRRPPARGGGAVAADEPAEMPAPRPTPNEVQREALAALARTREKGNRAGLVVLATGLGKTWLAAFDSERASRVLFVAHREEILDQALRTFRRIRPEATLGLYSGTTKTEDADVLFASIQTLGQRRHLERFGRRAFDYIVVDEFHHAAARTYRRLIDHFEPGFLLGLTATPERGDGGDLLALCDENLVYRCDLAEGIARGLLSPFHYYGVPDEVDYAAIPWRSSRFDDEALTAAVATRSRAENALSQHRRLAGSRTLAFCASTRHADFMADFFREAGLQAAAVHSGPTSEPRAVALERLREGSLSVLFAVDMFNEGVDVPAVDTVMMLRPTESRVVFLQQLGRGLRLAEGKPHLTVVDYIGNHRSFLLKPLTLLGLERSDDRGLGRALSLLAAGDHELPPGCEVTYELEALDLLRAMLRLPRKAEALQSWYEAYRERQGARPAAVHAFHEGHNVRSVRPRHGSWLRFVREMGDLEPAESEALDVAGGFLDHLEVTPMTRSYKMVVLQAMLAEAAIPGAMSLDALTSSFARVARRSEHLRADVGGRVDDTRKLKALLRRYPLSVWAEGKGTDGARYFDLDGETFSFALDLPERLHEPFRTLARELVDFRLAEYLASRAGR